MDEEKIVAMPMFVPQALFNKIERAAKKRDMKVPVFIATLIDEAIKLDEGADAKTSSGR